MVRHVKKEGGRLTTAETLEQMMSILANGDYAVTIETESQWKKRQPRTLNQNAMLHVWFQHIANALSGEFGDSGWTADDVKRYYAYKFRQAKQMPNGEVIEVSVETHKLNKRQMSDYMARVQADVAAELGIQVPLPDDARYAEFVEMYG